jgi:hypothetical protein
MSFRPTIVLILVPLLLSGCTVSRGNCEQVSLTERERCMAANEDSRTKVEARKKERKRGNEEVALNPADTQWDSGDDKWIP